MSDSRVTAENADAPTSLELLLFLPQFYLYSSFPVQNKAIMSCMLQDMTHMRRDISGADWAHGTDAALMSALTTPAQWQIDFCLFTSL